MNYIVLDLEWNVPYTLKNKKHNSNALRGEIIQIGAVKLDESLKTIGTFKILVAPKYYKKIQKNVSELTGITDEDLTYGLSFQVAIEHFKKWCGKDFLFFTWGTEDIDILKSNIQINKLSDKWIPATYNIQVIYDAQIAKENRQCSLLKAIQRLGEPEFEAHDALNDARSTAIICRYLDIAKGLVDYEQLELSFKWNAISSKVSPKTYRKIGQVLRDPVLTAFSCPVCGAKGQSEDFVPQKGGSKYIAPGKCINGHEFLARIKLKKDSNKKYTAVRLLYNMDEDNRLLYERKKTEAEESYKAYLQYKASK